MSSLLNLSANDLSINSININSSSPFPYQSTPQIGAFTSTGLYNDNTDSNIFHTGSYASNTGISNCVAVFGQGVSSGGGSCWGGNFVGYANNSTGSAQGIEIDYGVLVSGGTAVGLSVVATGSFPATTGIQIQSNNTASQPTNALRFHNRGPDTNGHPRQPATNALITTDANCSLPLGIDFSTASFSTAAIHLPTSTTPANGILFGDTNLYRSSSLTLQTDFNFTALGNISTSANRGLQFLNSTSSASTQTATLTNAPSAGNPSFWLKVSINGTNYSIPAWIG